MSYPQVMSEEATLDLALAGRSISRVGEGEIRLALGQKCISEVPSPGLIREMRAVLQLPEKAACLPCLPRIWDTMPNPKFWHRFRASGFTGIMGKRTFGSAFITRPDVAHNIDAPDYWQRCRDLWLGKDVVLVMGTGRSLTESMIADAASVRTVWGRQRDSYQDIDRIEEEIGKPAGPVLLCLGATATILAMRLAKKGVHALDLGHIGMFMPHQGIFAMRTHDTISPEYLKQQREMHARPEGYGGSSHRQAVAVMDWAKETGSTIIIDYGCGQGRLRTEMLKLGSKLTINEYDPAIEGKTALPKPADLVVCTDVLEHIERDKLGAVMSHLWSLSKIAGFFLIATRKANKTLPDGRNAHIIIEGREFWLAAIRRAGWKNVVKVEEVAGHDLKVWLRK